MISELFGWFFPTKQCARGRCWGNFWEKNPDVTHIHVTGHSGSESPTFLGKWIDGKLQEVELFQRGCWSGHIWFKVVPWRCASSAIFGSCKICRWSKPQTCDSNGFSAKTPVCRQQPWAAATGQPKTQDIGRISSTTCLTLGDSPLFPRGSPKSLKDDPGAGCAKTCNAGKATEIYSVYRFWWLIIFGRHKGVISRFSMTYIISDNHYQSPSTLTCLCHWYQEWVQNDDAYAKNVICRMSQSPLCMSTLRGKPCNHDKPQKQILFGRHYWVMQTLWV